MFDSVFVGVDGAGLIAAIERASREEAAAGARKLAAIAELVHTTVEEDDVRGGWAFDAWKNTACEVGAALSMGQRRSSGQMWIAVALRYRLPKLAELYCRGRVSARVVSEISWRTKLVDDDVVALVDAGIAARAQTWGPLSDAKLVSSIEAVIERHDPDAVRRAREVIRARDIHIGAQEDPAATAAIWGQLMAGDAAALEAVLTRMVAGVCAEDPRSMGDRRSDAMGAFIQGTEVLRCRCGSPDCPSTEAAAVASRVVIQVLADPAAVEAAQNLITTQDREHQQTRAEKAQHDVPSTPRRDEPAPAQPQELAPCPRDSGLALLPGVRVLPIAALAEAIRGGAAIKELWLPGADPEPRYRPSARLAAFVRARDMWCRFPGCDVPAERCDIDHVVPWPYGPTHPSNLNCKCRDHHLAKTFWDGWRDEQRPDGTVIWTTPAGQRYTTVPGSWLFFPAWDTTTAALAPMAQPPPDAGRTAKMPRRRRTRAAENAATIKAERQANALQRALDQQPPPPATPEPADYGDDPPPF